MIGEIAMPFEKPIAERVATLERCKPKGVNRKRQTGDHVNIGTNIGWVHDGALGPQSFYWSRSLREGCGYDC